MKVVSDLLTIERQIKSQLRELQEFSEDPDEISWNNEDGVILSGNQAVEILKLINKSIAMTNKEKFLALVSKEEDYDFLDAVKKRREKIRLITNQTEVEAEREGNMIIDWLLKYGDQKIEKDVAENLIRESIEVCLANIKDAIELDKGELFKVTNLSEINKLKELTRERESEIFHKMVEKRSDE